MSYNKSETSCVLNVFKNIYYLSIQLLSIRRKCHSRGLNNGINNLHERTQGSCTKTKGQILKLCLKMRSVLQFTWKTYIDLSLKFTKLKVTFFFPHIIRVIFDSRKEKLCGVKLRTRVIGKELVSNKIWPILPEELTNASSLQVFKNKLKEWKLTNCPCTPSCLIVARWRYRTKCTRGEIFLEIKT